MYRYGHVNKALLSPVRDDADDRRHGGGGGGGAVAPAAAAAAAADDAGGGGRALLGFVGGGAGEVVSLASLRPAATGVTVAIGRFRDLEIFSASSSALASSSDA